MRAFDILLICLCFNAAITIIDLSGLSDAFGQEGGWFIAETGGVWAKDLTGMQAFSNPASAIGGDMFLVAASWVIETTFIVVDFFLAAVFVIPAMMRIFHFPWYIAAGLQGLLYYVYLWAYIQWKGGKSLHSYW